MPWSRASPQRRWRKDLNLVPEAGQPVRRGQLVLERQRHNPPAVRIGPKRRLERRSDPRPEDLGKDRDRLGRGAERDLKGAFPAGPTIWKATGTRDAGGEGRSDMVT